MTEPAASLARAERLIAAIPDHPEPGVVFRDINPLLADGDAFRAVVDAVVDGERGRFDLVAGIEARGFLLAGAIARATGVGLVPIRKAGKLPRPVAQVAYDLEYGRAVLEIGGELEPGRRVLLVDDVLATGGTIAAARELIARVGAEVVGTAVLLELDGLGGRARLGEAPLRAVFHA